MIKITKEELLQKKRDLVEKKAKLEDKLDEYLTKKYASKIRGRIEEIQQFIDWINQILQSS